MTEQHYRMNLADAIAQYKAGLITATALVYYYIRIKRATGWKITLHEESVSKELGIKKSTFYKAIAKLLEKGLIQTEKSKVVITVLESSPQTVESSPQTVDSSPQTVDSSPQTVDSSPQTVENQSLKPLQSKDSGSTTNIKQISNSFLNLSLSDLKQGERENFEKFVREEYFREEKKKIRSFTAFMGNGHFQEWLERWNNRPEAVQVTTNSKWRNHPQFENWLAEVERTGNPMMFASGNKEKKEFIKWANSNKIFSWQREEEQ